MNLKKAWKQATIALILTTVSTSCTTFQKNNAAVIPDPIDSNGTSVVEYYPEVTIISGEGQEQKKDLVTMPLWYWKKIVRFMVDAKAE